MDLWSSGKAKEAYACLMESLLMEVLKEDKELHLRILETQLELEGVDEKERQEALAVALGAPVDERLVLELVNLVISFEAFPFKAHTGINIA
jgi:hypothetical protein